MRSEAGSAHVSVVVDLRDTTELSVHSFPEATGGGPFVSVKIGRGGGQVAVMAHNVADLDRLAGLVAEARASLARMLGDTAWARHDDPTVSDNPAVGVPVVPAESGRGGR